MTLSYTRPMRLLGLFASLSFALLLLVAGLVATPAKAEITAFKQAVAEAASKDKAVAAFYRSRGFEPIWTGSSSEDAKRRKAFIAAAGNAAAHALPTERYTPEMIKSILGTAKTQRDLGRAEVEMSRLFAQFAQDLSRGVVAPSSIDEGIVREVKRYSSTSILESFAKSSPAAFIKSLAPDTPEYVMLMKQKLVLEKKLASGGWGPTVPGKKLEPGQSNANVVALRNRLMTMGYLKRTSSKTFDANLQKAVQQFQIDHGLLPDGVAGAGTLKEINTPVEQRLKSVMVAMERERWLNGMERGKRHVWVNLTDFHARIIDDGKVTFKTRSVVGRNTHDRRTPEFSDIMEHMVINPTWNVPRSIATKEYLPMLQRNPNAVSHLRLIDSSGRIVSREGADFTQYNARNFPFDIKQPPSRRNALGLVKFMFPNRHNIYLHDTPEKHLFQREARSFSHGCIRLRDPFDFAYTLLAPQVSNPQAYFKERLDTGRETVVELDVHVPVHLVYRTAVAVPKGKMNYRRDVYGRDAKIFAAMSKAGVELRAVQS
ncbi:L,D-transpeptidase family protein [Halocynthiibacter sp. C4]|uniref:L,D-transpeptidase family protein n=1 Tax=Halocynthiibacter sp. C4 TaxID=2992758 RepID=UPI00237BCC29|nr:L,D-transpeptidase family protein [Halocynthiibacter sp. C4]MDE0589533.1 L,D-transpeptidase family protein [Halocynthiibacter sp. C4]